jgi:DNA-binding winged helix-turn-helix (wHTH) protein
MPKSPARVRFADFVVDHGARQLIRGEQPVHLTPKAYHLLTLLLDARPRALSKDELQQGLWPATFVDEANLTVLVAELRSALHDDARHPRFIRTVHGFGYAFSADAAASDAVEPILDARSVAWWLIADAVQVKLTNGRHVVGRDPSVEVWLDSASVSRRHARLDIDGADATVEDLGSKNGTWVNGERVGARLAVSAGDELRFGSVRAQLRRVWEAGSTETIGPLR